MKYAIISDIHANLQALDNVLRDAGTQGAEQFVCLGDIVGYGPLPGETLRRIREVSSVVIAGNHDDAVSGRISDADFIDLAADAVKRHREALTEKELAWLKTLPYTAALDGAIAAHGDVTEPEAFEYIDDLESARRNFAASDFQLMFVGHTHIPGIFLTGHSGSVYRLDPTDFQLEDGKRYIVNPGSVGYPRESRGQCHSSYILYDSTSRIVFFRRLPFAVSSVMQRGANPKSFRRRIMFAVGAAAALVSGLSSYLLIPGETKVVEKTALIEKTVYEDDPALTIGKKTLTLPKSARTVRAGYKIERANGLADLHIVFRTATGDIVQVLKFTPKGSSNQPIKIPEGAISADFVIRRRRLDDRPQIRSFSPKWE